MDRRTSIKWVLAVSAAWSRLGYANAPDPSIPADQGYGTDPNLMKVYRPGDSWPLTLTGPQQHTAAALADVILPADAQSPSATTVGAVAFIDEWVSAPYPRNQADRPIILGGLARIEQESQRRFGSAFTALSASQHTAICDDICDTARVAPAFLEPARFFALFRDLTAAAYYCSAAGRQDLGYIGNVARLTFEPPPADLLKKLNLP